MLKYVEKCSVTMKDSLAFSNTGAFSDSSLWGTLKVLSYPIKLNKKKDYWTLEPQLALLDRIEKHHPHLY